eukprot:3748623-Rhodomonas_salina.4
MAQLVAACFFAGIVFLLLERGYHPTIPSYAMSDGLLRAPYATAIRDLESVLSPNMVGTETAYRGSRHNEFDMDLEQASFIQPARSCAMSAIDLAYATLSAYACPSTDLAYGALSAYAHPRRCPSGSPASWYAPLPAYAMSGTGLAATRCAVMA